jgi:hypothetical protein
MNPRPLFPAALAVLALGGIAVASCQEPGGTADRDHASAASPLEKTAPAPFLTLAWGSEPGQLGHKLDPESAPEGPMSLTTDREGRLFVLDQVNRRVQVFGADGKLAKVVPIGSDTVQDLLVLDDGTLVLLDRLRARSLVFLAPSGERAEVPLEGHGIAEGGGVSGLLAFGESVWVDVEGQALVRVADLRGKPDLDRTAWDGRPSRKDGTLWRLTLPEKPDKTALLRRVARSGKVLASRAVAFDMPIRHLTAQETDRQGRLYLGAHLELRDGGGRVVEEKESLLVLSPEGKRLAKMELPATEGPEEQFRTIDVSPEGLVHQLRCTDAGVEIRRWKP